MMSLKLPIEIIKGKLAEEESTVKAIDNNIDLLLSTPQYSCAADPAYGFIFNNLRFEIFNEKEGVVYNSLESEDRFQVFDELYNKKISGSSKNLNTFASELKDAITIYEKRLINIKVTMTYIREEKTIYVNVTGEIKENGESYDYTTTLRVWR